MRRDWSLAVVLGSLLGAGMLVQARMAGTALGVGAGPLIVGLVLGAAAAGFCGRGRLGRLLNGRGAYVVAGGAVLLLGALLLFGRTYRGGLYLPGRINPSELVKLCVVLFTAGVWARGPTLRARWIYVGLMGMIAGGIVLVRDFGLLAQLALTAAVMVWLASWFWGLAAFGVLGMAVGFIVLHPVGHLATRLAVWRDPLADVTGAGWQTLLGLTAIVAGGWRGVGWGLGEVELVPIVSSDFVYAALAEELGWLGCAILLGAWLFVFLRGLLSAARSAAAGNRTEAFVSVGLVASLSVQLLLNVGGVLNAVPMTGITLPLVSHGGSSLVTTLVMCGMLFGLSKNEEESVSGQADRLNSPDGRRGKSPCGSGEDLGGRVRCQRRGRGCGHARTGGAQ